MQNFVQELAGGFLFELEAVADAVAGVDDDRYAKRQRGLGGEFRMACGFPFSSTSNSSLAEAGDESGLCGR